MENWHNLRIEQVVEVLNTDIKSGLDDLESSSRLEQYGSNELIDQGVKPSWQILLDQFKETMVLILLIAALISVLLGEYIDAVAILIIVVLNALLGFTQERKAENAIEALKQLSVPIVRVRRNGRISEVSAKTLVPGDIVLLEAGNVVPADCRMVESVNLQVQEAALTGESAPVSKFTAVLEESDVPLADRNNMVYMGTLTTYGRGQCVVTGTGMHTELGSIATLMQSSKKELTPLQKRLNQLGKGLAVAALVLVGIVFILGYINEEELNELILTSISIAVAAIPEGLPAVVTIALALGARRMLERRALIRKLPAVEALGSVTVICSDKTGTLTENRMTVTILDIAENRLDLTEEEMKVFLKDVRTTCFDVDPDLEQEKILVSNPALTLLLAGGALCNDAVLECSQENEENFQIVGDPTEGALLLASLRLGLFKEKLESVFPRVWEIPFDSDRKMMTTIHKMPASIDEVPDAYKSVWDWRGWTAEFDYVEFTKGAIDSLLNVSNRVWINNEVFDLDDHWRQRIDSANESLAQKGMRVLGVAVKSVDPVDGNYKDLELEKNLIFVGLVGMIDPARPEVKEAVQTSRTAGVRPVMITGDHPLTAAYIAKELGILNGSEHNNGIITGRELEQLNQSELINTSKKISVYARVTPEHKLRIVEALQAQNEIVAMTGDGVNDAPALKTADIGIAMGITGTDVSKEASDMVLLDDNFATIVSAIKEGRIIYDNIRKFIQYTLSSNAGEIWIMLIAPFLGMPLPLLPLQILWINLVTDGLPGLALSVEKGEMNTMRRPPYEPKENVFARGLGINILWVGLLMAVISLGIGYIYYLENPDGNWRTMIFTTITLSEMGYVMAIRSNRDSVFKIGFLSNRSLVGAVLLTIVLQLAIIYIPIFHDLFNTEALPIQDLVICILLSTVVFWAVEFQKLIKRIINK